MANGYITPEKIRKLRFGLSLDGKKLKKAQIFHEDEKKLRFILTEGRKRQIRRMCDLVGLEVTSLRRVRIGQIKLGSLPIGQWRLLKNSEKII